MSEVKFTSNADRLKTELQGKIDIALEICGGMIESYAAQLCPTETGNLKGSITHQQENENTEVIGTTVSYAPFVELGHHQEPGRYVPAIKKRLVRSWIPGKPFLRPAVENHVREYTEVVKRVFSSNT